MKKIIFLFIISLILTACARVGSPVGGAKDTIPPHVIGSNIDTARINVPQNIKELRIDFDEYIQLKDINKNLIISPPLKKITKIIPSSMANKYLLIKWEDTLQANTTYNFNFGNAIVDNNEGNALQYYNFAFSTGEKIDDLYISGDLTSNFSEKETRPSERNLVVGLYQAKDSMDYRQKPYYIAKADADGYFELNYLSPGKYHIVAFDDANSNSIFDPGKESVGFLKEEVDLEKSISGLKLDLYPSKKEVKYLEMKETPGGILMLFEGKPKEVQVSSRNQKLQDYKVTHIPYSDSLNIWFNAKKDQIGIAQSENLKFNIHTGVKQDSASLFYRLGSSYEMKITNSGGNLLAPGQPFKIKSNYYLDAIDTKNWTLVSDSLQQPFNAEISEKNPFEIMVTADFKEGKKYSLTIPKETVSSFYEKLEKSYRFDFQSDKTENYGSLHLNLENAPSENFWVQMISESGDVKYVQFGKGTQLNFNAIKPGKYKLRILVDNNGNGVWDSADFGKGIFAENLYLFQKTVDIRPLWEIRETWDVAGTSKTDATITPETKTPEISSEETSTPDLKKKP